MPVVGLCLVTTFGNDTISIFDIRCAKFLRITSSVGDLGGVNESCVPAWFSIIVTDLGEVGAKSVPLLWSLF